MGQLFINSVPVNGNVWNINVPFELPLANKRLLVEWLGAKN